MRDDSNGEIRFIIQDLEKFWIFTEFTILPFLRKLDFLGVSQGSPIFLPKFGSEFLRTKSFCFENWIFFLTLGLGICEGVGENSGHGIGHVDIRVGSCNCLNVFVFPCMCT